MDERDIILYLKNCNIVDVTAGPNVIVLTLSNGVNTNIIYIPLDEFEGMDL